MHNYGWFLCQQQRYAEAERAVRAGAGACRSTATPPRTLLAQGVCQARAGQLAEAEAHAACAPTSSIRPTRSPRSTWPRCCYRRGDYERARFYIRRVNAHARASRMRRRCGWRRASRTSSATAPGRRRVRHAAAQSLPAVARGRGVRRGARSMSERRRGAAAPPATRRPGALLRAGARGAGPAHRRAGRGDQGHAAQARAARGRPLRRAARRHLHARAGADRLPRAEDRRRRRCWRCCRSRPGHRLEQRRRGPEHAVSASGPGVRVPSDWPVADQARWSGWPALLLVGALRCTCCPPG